MTTTSTFPHAGISYYRIFGMQGLGTRLKFCSGLSDDIVGVHGGGALDDHSSRVGDIADDDNDDDDNDDDDYDLHDMQGFGTRLQLCNGSKTTLLPLGEIRAGYLSSL